MYRAILETESRGSGFLDDGRLKVRFELHIFKGYLHPDDETEFNKYFKIDDNRILDHWYRNGFGDPWRYIHSSGDREYEAIKLALRTFPGMEEQVGKSLGMGIAQIMGFNHSIVGYPSSQDMYNSFLKSEENQIDAFHKFIAETKGDLSEAIKNKDWQKIARIYNGPANVKQYASELEENYNTLKVKNG